MCIYLTTILNYGTALIHQNSTEICKTPSLVFKMMCPEGLPSQVTRPLVSGWSILTMSPTYSTVQHSTVQYSTVQYSTVQYSTAQYSKG